MKKLKNIFVILVLILSHGMCLDVGFNHAKILCGIEHMGFSAPANVAFFVAVPYVIGIIICMVFIIVLNKKCGGK